MMCRKASSGKRHNKASYDDQYMELSKDPDKKYGSQVVADQTGRLIYPQRLGVAKELQRESRVETVERDMATGLAGVDL
jgi:hypothetical protein